MPTDTIKQLAAITDAAQFERIATSVLRAARPSLYANLSHQGVNTDGKTVKAPLDNVGWVRIDEESMLVAAAHTIADRNDLEGKWLHDPATVKPRKKDGQPTQPAGDLVKAIGELAKLREENPSLRSTLALTCNREEPAGVRVKAETLAKAADVSLDIWSVSRIAQWLDTTADGQAIRNTYLGTPAVLLSKAELIRAGQLSLDARVLPTDPASMIERTVQLTGTGHVILSGASGMGKTTLCLELLRTSLANGQAGLVLRDQTLRDATSIEEAIDMELRRHLPYLEPLAGSKALDLCSDVTPLVIVIEDISRAENTVGLLDKVVAWALHSMSKRSTDSQRNWRLLCPVWPRFMPAAEKSKDAYTAGIVQSIGLYSEKEAIQAVKSRGILLGRPQSDMSAAALARALGRDPLLIGLHEFTGTGQSQAQDVIAEYVAREFASAALSAGLTASDVEGAVERLGLQMLNHKLLTPAWSDVLDWLDREDDRKALRALVGNGRVLRLARINGNETIEARHDRVLHSLLSLGIASRLATGIGDAYLSDPYFAEYIGSAAVQVKLGVPDLLRLLDASPLIAFFALKEAISRNSDYAHIVAGVIESWLSSAETQSPAFFTRRQRALGVLSDIDSSLILDLTEKFPPHDRHQLLFEARFRNGDFSAALDWLTEYPFELKIGGRQELVDYVHSRFGERLIHAVASVLESQRSKPRDVLGALYLAGYLGEPELARAVRAAWNGITPKERNLEAFLWAAARVCGNDAAITLGPVCDAWAALPEPDDQFSTELSRSSLAAHGVSWKFRDHPPLAALPYFVQRASEENLRWPITYMLRAVDDPIAVQHMAEYLAAGSRQTEGAFLDHFVKDEWRRLSQDQGRSMSTESKARLLHLATELCNDNHLRKQAFKLWEISVSPDDVIIARAIPRGDLLHDTAVWARARRQDFSVISELIEKIRTKNAAYWWQAGRYIWTDALTTLLDESIEKLGETPADQNEALGEWIFPELLLRLEVTVAKQILIKHWNSLRTNPRFVQVALFLATPETVSLANQAIASAEDKRAIFKHFSFTTGLMTSGRAGLTREIQLDVLKPHLGLLEEHDLLALWEICNRKNWTQYRRKHLDPLLLTSDSKLADRLRIDPPFDMADLEKELSGTPSLAYRWLEIQQNNGAEREVLLASLLAWVRVKNSVAALEVAGNIFSKDAGRAEFDKFEKLAAEFSESEHVIKRVRFDIFSRTLN